MSYDLSRVAANASSGYYTASKLSYRTGIKLLPSGYRSPIRVAFRSQYQRRSTSVAALKCCSAYNDTFPNLNRGGFVR